MIALCIIVSAGSQEQKKSRSEEPEITTESAEALISEIQMKKMPGGTYEVPCTINGLPLKFIFDTGASDVTLSSVETNFMLKNDYLNEKDFKGSRRYLTADGPQTLSILPPPEVRDAWKKDYQAMQDSMIYEESPSFDRLIETLSALNQRINALSY